MQTSFSKVDEMLKFSVRRIKAIRRPIQGNQTKKGFFFNSNENEILVRNSMLTSRIILSVRILYNDVDFNNLSWLLQDISLIH